MEDKLRNWRKIVEFSIKRGKIPDYFIRVFTFRRSKLSTAPKSPPAKLFLLANTSVSTLLVEHCMVFR